MRCSEERQRESERAGWFPTGATMDLVFCYLSLHLHLLASTILVTQLCFINGVFSDKLLSALDKCSPNPCQNRALCRVRGDSYACFCVPGFQGAHCQINVNECVSQPCRNRGTCLDGVGTYECLCAPGFTGLSCERDIDECQSEPCLNGGSCHDDVGGFSCTCPPGFHGDQCQINTDECQDEPCQNGARCRDGVNEYSCDCSNTAFTGQHCEIPLPACHSEPCFNSALCQDTHSNYSCQCWPGFEGRQCEVDIPECSSSPCLHGGRCVERSWQVLYGSEPLLPVTYDPHNAEGFICSCPNGTTGALCEEVIEQCSSSPCQNGGTCESFVGGYLCHCPKHHSPSGALYGGPNCAERLVGCDGHKCQNQGSCSPFFLDGTHGYTCSCPPGFTGPLCKTSTTFSFERRGYLLLQSPLVETELSVNVTLSFRTVLPRALLFQRNTRGLLLTLSLHSGRLRLTLAKDSSAVGLSESPPERPMIQVLELPHNVTDGQWHSVEATLGNWVLSLKQLDLERSHGAQTYHKVAPVQIPADPVSPPQNTYIGGVLEGPDGRGSAFVGCMSDVFVDWQLVIPEEWLSNSAVNVSPGCAHRDRCLDVPCQNGGECVNLWQSYQCHCPRPYEGPDCDEVHFVNLEMTNGTMTLYIKGETQGYLEVKTVNIQAGDVVFVGGLTEREEATAFGGNLKGCVQDLRINDRRLQFFGLDASVRSYPLLQLENVTAGCTGDDKCSRNPCLNGGMCFSMWDDFSCSCPPSTSGRHCEEVRWCELAPCPPEAECRVLSQGYESRPVPPDLPELAFARLQWSFRLCAQPCLNGGQCQDLFNWFNCSCAGGWAGRRCDLFVNACASDPCRHGNCSVKGLSYECSCDWGYAGLDCEEEVDMCENHLCANGGTCLHGPKTYSCLCPDNYTGPFCSERLREAPWYIVVKTTRPKLPVSVCGDIVKNYTCFNGGNCTERELSCDCPPGFTGHRCELEVDECRSNPCLNGGYCRNLVNKFACICDMSFAGDVCEIDVSDIYFYVALLLWQNLFQLLSY
ncbi:hypothetical protein WMY93_024163 [Mugilogobius chulae]|uniref:Protein crumbs homolog 2 n=1 Tax=Mugilogobius chulae TaxID=88201 RepID=A0AAW0N0F0_9GOBI